jgi:hypothetical protein
MYLNDLPRGYASNGYPIFSSFVAFGALGSLLGGFLPKSTVPKTGPQIGHSAEYSLSGPDR